MPCACRGFSCPLQRPPAAGRLAAACIVVLLAAGSRPAQAEGELDLTLPSPSAAVPSAPSATAPAESDGVAAVLLTWQAQVARARATQPSWSSPLVTTTGLLEQRLRFDLDEQHAGNGSSTTVLDGGKGVDVIVSDADEVQLAAPGYNIRTTPSGTGELSGVGDWAFLRVERRLASSPESGGNYVLTAWLQLQAPTGIEALTSHAWTCVPTLAFGKGWGDVDLQGTIGGALPASHTATLGDQLQTNIALQYDVLGIFWLQIEANWTYYAGGQRSGLNQLYLTPGLVVGRLTISDELAFTVGAGYQFAVSPSYRANPLTPAYNHAWVLTSRLNF